MFNPPVMTAMIAAKTGGDSTSWGQGGTRTREEEPLTVKETQQLSKMSEWRTDRTAETSNKGLNTDQTDTKKIYGQGYMDGKQSHEGGGERKE